MSDRLENAPCGFVELRQDGLIHSTNVTFEQWIGSAGKLAGERFESTLTLANRIFFQTHLFPLLHLSGRADEIFLNLRGSDGKALPVVASFSLGEENRFQCVFLPVPNRRKYEDEILERKKIAEEALKSNAQLLEAKLDAESRALDLERKVREIEHQNKELKRVSEILSHDLREPIRKIMIFSDLAKTGVGDAVNAEAHEAVKKIDSEASKMEQLIAVTRQFLQIDTSSAPTSVDLAGIWESAVEAVALKWAFSDWSVESKGLLSIEGRKNALLLLFSHLLENAIKFRSPDRKLKISLLARVVQENVFETTKDRYHYVDFLKIELRDNGKGFDPQYSEYAFGLLRKIDLNSSGLGAGLALCRKVVESHFGNITVDSQWGVGTVFILSLPINQNARRILPPKDGDRAETVT
jgi:sigma-B regulation protein RsbU (phosphoserine phosphatase)